MYLLNVTVVLHYLHLLMMPLTVFKGTSNVLEILLYSSHDQCLLSSKSCTSFESSLWTMGLEETKMIVNSSLNDLEFGFNQNYFINDVYVHCF